MLQGVSLPVSQPTEKPPPECFASTVPNPRMAVSQSQPVRQHCPGHGMEEEGRRRRMLRGQMCWQDCAARNRSPGVAPELQAQPRGRRAAAQQPWLNSPACKQQGGEEEDGFLSSITLKGKDEGLARRGWEEAAPDSRESQPCAAPCATSPPAQHNADSCTAGAVPTQAASSPIPRFQRESRNRLRWNGS